MSRNPLFESRRATADVNGRARVTLSPQRAFERWQVERITVQSTSSVLVPKCEIYRGAETASRLVDGTWTGTFDHTDTSLMLQTGEEIIVLWVGGDVSSECTVTIEGVTVR